MQMQKIDSNYIVGLVDGEGSFTVYVKDPDSKKVVKRRTKVEPRFYLKLVEEDKDILYELKKFFGCGNVYFQPDTRKNHKDCYRYEVAARDDLNLIIIPFFKKHCLRVKSKADDFEIFCRIMIMIERKDHLNELGLRKIFLQKSLMH